MQNTGEGMFLNLFINSFFLYILGLVKMLYKLFNNPNK